jgi:hypothetical protein
MELSRGKLVIFRQYLLTLVKRFLFNPAVPRQPMARYNGRSAKRSDH